MPPVAEADHAPVLDSGAAVTEVKIPAHPLNVSFLINFVNYFPKTLRRVETILIEAEVEILLSEVEAETILSEVFCQ